MILFNYIIKAVRKAPKYIIRGAPLAAALFLIASYELGIHLDQETYYSIAVYLYETINTNLFTGVLLLAICSRHKLCRYNWISSWVVIITSVFNMFAKYNFNESDFYYYAALYSIIVLPFALLLISIAFFKRNPKKDVRQFNRL